MCFQLLSIFVVQYLLTVARQFGSSRKFNCLHSSLSLDFLLAHIVVGLYMLLFECSGQVCSPRLLGEVWGRTTITYFYLMVPVKFVLLDYWVMCGGGQFSIYLQQRFVKLIVLTVCICWSHGCRCLFSLYVSPYIQLVQSMRMIIILPYHPIFCNRIVVKYPVF